MRKTAWRVKVCGCIDEPPVENRIYRKNISFHFRGEKKEYNFNIIDLNIGFVELLNTFNDAVTLNFIVNGILYTSFATFKNAIENNTIPLNITIKINNYNNTIASADATLLFKYKTATVGGNPQLLNISFDNTMSRDTIVPFDKPIEITNVLSNNAMVHYGVRISNSQSINDLLLIEEANIAIVNGVVSALSTPYELLVSHTVANYTISSNTSISFNYLT